MLDLVRERLKQFPPQEIVPGADEPIRNAAVLLALTTEADPGVIFVKRAEHVSSHSGQVAFPGGMWEPPDSSLLMTALRESEEEIALPPQQVEMLASLPPRHTRFDVRVTPYIGLVPPGLDLVPEPAELETLFQVPLSYLANPANLTTTRFSLFDGDYEVSCYLFQQYCIWGFTLGIAAEFLELVLDVRLDLQFHRCLKMR